MSKVWLLILLLITVVAFQAYRISVDAGVFVDVDSIPFGSCEKLLGPLGSEDITVDRIHQVAFISAANGRAILASREDPSVGVPASGDIWLLDMSDSRSQPHPLKVSIAGGFHPHGIDLLQLDDGRRELYVVNHPGEGQNEVLIFSIGSDHRLALKRRVSYPALIAPNDIRAISEDVFMATNDHGSPTSSVMARVEEYLGLSRSSVTYFDGEQGDFLIRGLKSANGITLSEDQSILYVGEALGRKIKRFRRGESLRDWTLTDSIDTGTAVDNLEWSDRGTLVSGTHPKLFDFVAHALDEQKRSPSQVIEVDVSGPEMRVNTLYMNAGDELSGSSVGTLTNGTLLVGSVFENHFLRCTNG